MNRFTLVLAPRLYKLLMLGITVTCHRRQVGQKRLKQLRKQGQNWIYSGWHNNTAIATWALGNQNMVIMTSDSTDGELIARGVRSFGNIAVRGSTSSQGSRAARAMIKALSNGYNAAITPDGPRGPKYVLQRGVLYIAALSACPLVPYHIEATRQWEFDSWDTHKIPKPFSTIWESFGTPYFVDKDRLQAEPDVIAEEFQTRMMLNVGRCVACVKGAEASTTEHSE